MKKKFNPIKDKKKKKLRCEVVTDKSDKAYKPPTNEYGWERPD